MPSFIRWIEYVLLEEGNRQPFFTYKELMLNLLPSRQVECLKGRGEFNFEDIRFENENVNAFDVDEDDSDSNTTETSEALLDDP